MQENSYLAFYYVKYAGVAIVLMFSELYTKYVNSYFFYTEIELDIYYCLCYNDNV